jgi:hypothetical protein
MKNDRRLETRVTTLENVVTKHLEESGTIRTDLSWLKRAFWTMAGALVTFNFGIIAAVIFHFIK